MIEGLTHVGGKPRSQLNITHKVSIGRLESAGEGRTKPVKLDHFRFQTRGRKGGWVDDHSLTAELSRKYSREKNAEGKVQAFPIILGSNSLEETFRTELAHWSTKALLCRGDGQRAKRREALKANKPFQPYAGPCGRECPIYQKGKCKPSGDLFFAFADRPAVGAVAVFHTTSRRTILSIHSALMDLDNRTGGRISGIPLMLVMRPFVTRYHDSEGEVRRGTAYSVNVEYRAEDQDIVRRLMADAMATTPLPPIDTTAQLLAPAEVVKEFHPELVDDDDAPGDDEGAPPVGEADDEGDDVV